MCNCGTCPSCLRLEMPAPRYKPDDWKPGDVALVEGHVSVMARNGAWQWADGFTTIPLGPVRRLLIIDPEDREQVERLIEVMAQAKVWAVIPQEVDRIAAYRADQMQAALRAMLEPPQPPKPEEPLGLGAVVRDADGVSWVRVFPDGGPAKWRRLGAGTNQPRSVWSAIDAVEVLSEGWTA